MLNCRFYFRILTSEAIKFYNILLENLYFLIIYMTYKAKTKLKTIWKTTNLIYEIVVLLGELDKF